MATLVSAPLARLVRPIVGENELDQLLDLVAQARIVLLGSASYGTHEHYDLRASLTRKLIGERGFDAVVIEADWPDALRVDRYVRNHSDDDDAAVALTAFDHFPAWAWRNEDVERFVEWLRAHNCCRRASDRAGFYGLDLFAMNAASRATHRSLHAQLDVGDDDLLAELCDMQWRHAARSGRAPSGEAWLHAMQRAHARHAVAYYRTWMGGGDGAWNLRSAHMADTIDMLAKELGTADEPARLVVWAHDHHVGDARAALRGDRRSLGQHVREQYGDEVALVGFTTYAGTLHVAPEWGAPANDERLPPSHPTSWEAVFHEVGIPRFMVTASALRRAHDLDAPRPHRTVGAVLRSDPYIEVQLAALYDVIVHVDTTRAVVPLASLSAGDTQAMAEAHVHASS